MNRAKKIIVGTGIAGSLALGSQMPVQPNISIQEWQEITRMYNQEIEKAGGKITIEKFSGDIKELNDEIRKISSDKEEERELLLKKTEPKTLLETIIGN
jgi:hypothetical protein